MIRPEVYEVHTASGSRYLVDIVSGLLMRQPGPQGHAYTRDGYLVVVGDILQIELGAPLKIRPYPGRWDSAVIPLETTPIISLQLLTVEDPMTWPIHPEDKGKHFGDSDSLP